MLKTRLDLWETVGYHKGYPENIFVYRDGVSKGHTHELVKLEVACKEKYAKQDLPQITIVVCGKRHKTRFFPTRVMDCDATSNPRAGTVVDHGVTESQKWDFYLQSQGTARPCHSYVIHDEIFLYTLATEFWRTADVVESLTYNMCYLFGRATTSVSLCPPVYYAHLAYERARCYLEKQFGNSGTDTSDTDGLGSTSVPANIELQIHPNLRAQYSTFRAAIRLTKTPKR
ncbi:hypothetical protein DM02DRAFT_695329 [Periconia macrospinosa]|uniref:Piwi domain-containing protein n=1 Tax=Periconia macrospinosa TaxID=97972 RepID=A0A2V1D6I8_9PLEO|nr:hypothetical protein DM02DRAFT_695329 [Periconia macrospinosa]